MRAKKTRPGDAGIDLLTAGETFEDLIFAGLPRLPALGEELRVPAFSRTVGGGALITAVAASRLGLRCGVLSGLGDAARSLLDGEKIRAHDLRRPGEPHAVTAALSTASDRSFVTFDGVNTRLELRLARALPAHAPRHVHLALVPRRCGPWVARVRALRSRGIGVSWDFGWGEALAEDPRLFDLLAELDLVFLNEAEAKRYGGRSSLGAAVTRLAKAARSLVVKLGARGARFLGEGVELEAPAPRVRAVDTTGAGDAFDGGFLFARLRGATPSACLRAGNRMGALSTRALGGIAGLPPARAPGRRSLFSRRSP